MLLVTFGLFMQMYASLLFFRLLVTQSNWKFLISFSPQILHFTRSSTHSNVHVQREIRAKLNQIKSVENCTELCRKSIDPPGKVSSVAIHLSRLHGDNQPLGEGRTQLSKNLSWWCKVGLHLVHIKGSVFVLETFRLLEKTAQQKSSHRRKLWAPPWS